MAIAVTTFSVVVAWHYFLAWRKGGFRDVSSNLWVALIIGTLLDIVLFAVLDVGQAIVLVTEGWGGIVGICASVLLPLLGYKAMTKVISPKGGSLETDHRE